MKNETNTKLELFNVDFADEKKFELNLEKLFQSMFLNIFPNILNLPRIDFMNSLMTSVKSILEEQYSNQIYSNEKFFSLFLSVNKIFEKKYKDYNQVLSTAWDNYSTENNNNNYFKEFKKHCGKTQENAAHLCNKKNKNETGNYLIVYLKKEIKFIICEKCRKSYYSNLFVNYCQNCKCNYYSGIITQKENSTSQLATYASPHCDSIVNDKIPCIKCKNPLYYNIKDNMVECNNKACNYKIRPNFGNWKCNVCSSYFKSDIKLYNHFDLLYLKRIYGIALLIKQKAHPGILPCCQDLDEKNLIFSHKKECDGILYFWIMNKKIIVICEKCKAINYFNRFIWTCPNCGLHFRAKKEEIEEKIRKTFMNNMKKKFNTHIILGEEFLLDNSKNNNDNVYETLNNDGYKMVRKRSFKEILELKKKGGYSNEKIIHKEKEEETINIQNKEKKKFIPRNNNDNLFYFVSSKNKVTIESESKPNLKKRKNYLFDKLLRNQFITVNHVSDSKNNNPFKRANSGAFYFTDQKDTLEEQNVNKNINLNNNNNINNNNKGYRFGLRAKSGILKNELNEFLKNNNLENKNIIGKENDINSIAAEDKADKKKEKIKKNMPPLPFRIKNKLNYNSDVNHKYKLILEFQYERQNNYKTPRMIIINPNNNIKSKKEESSNKIKRHLSDKILKKYNIDSFNFKNNINLSNKKNDKKKDKIVRRLDYKFSEDNSQKKTKNRTDSDEGKSDKEGKAINKNEEVKVIIKNDNIGFKNIGQSKIPKDDNKNNDVISIENESNKIENKQRHFPLFKRFKENDTDFHDKKININSRPSDIINASMLDSQMDIIVENEAIKKDKLLYESIQSQIKRILSKGHLPIFNIDNYKIEKQIGEGSFGLIYQVMNKKSYIKYAMKKIIANNLKALESFQTEFEIVHQNSHPNILDILGICIRCLDQTTFVLYVLMDLALHDWDYEIEQRKKEKKYYTENELISILKQISSALLYLQKVKRIAHRDVKPENILVFSDGKYKLGDFGEAKINRLRRNNARSTIRGTEMYMSPALFKALQENKDDIKHDIYKSDVFSLGYCFVYAAVLDFKIIDDIRNINSDFKVRKILQRVLFLRYSTEFIELIYKMICVNEDDRIDFIGLDKLLKEQKF